MMPGLDACEVLFCEVLFEAPPDCAAPQKLFLGKISDMVKCVRLRRVVKGAIRYQM
jgi:hypothetical protein